jgi:hypothetical protein
VHGPPTGRSREFYHASAIIHQTIHARRRTVRCASRQRLATTSTKGQWSNGAPDSPVPLEQEISQSGDSLPHPACTLFTVPCALDGPVHPWSEGNQSLPNGAPIAPSSLRAINGTPRHIEQHTRHPLNILQRETSQTHIWFIVIEIQALL